MPYESNAELPAEAKQLPARAQSVFRRVFNDEHKRHGDEQRAFATAWTAVKNGWRKGGGGWVRKAATFDQILKDQPGVGSVHVANAGAAGSIQEKKRKARLYAQIAERNMGATEAQVQKFIKAETVDDNLGLVLGWAIVCKENGQDYFDVQGDHIPEDAMLAAAADFMANSRAGNEMHAGPERGSYVFAWPVTTEIAKAMGLQTNRTGLMVGYMPPPDVLEKFRSGAYTGFSIEGFRVRDEAVTE